jgi:hypothetical protein
MPIDWDSHRRLSKDEYTRWEEAVSDHWRLPRRIDGGVEPLNWQVPRRDLTYFERWDAEESGLERDTIVTLSGAAADAAMASRSSHVAALQRSLGRPGCDPLIAVVDHGDALAVELPA